MSQKQDKDKKIFSHPRWNEPINGEIVGYEVLPEEMQKEVHEDAIAVLKSMGIKPKKEQQE